MKTEKQIIARPEWVERTLKTARASINEALEIIENNKEDSDIEFWIDYAKKQLNSALQGVKQ